MMFVVCSNHSWKVLQVKSVTETKAKYVNRITFQMQTGMLNTLASAELLSAQQEKDLMLLSYKQIQ